MNQRVDITQGPDGEPVVTPIDEEETLVDIEATDEDNEVLEVVYGENKVIVKHTYCYVAGNQTQYTTVGVELVVGDGATIEETFDKANSYATHGVTIAADTLTQMINDRRKAAKTTK